MDLDAFRYFLVNLGWHNLVLVLAALALGLVLGRLVWGKSKLGMDQLRERLKAEETQLEEARGEIREVREEYETFRQQVESVSGGPAVVQSPELEAEVQALKKAAKKSEELVHKATGDLGQMVQRLEGLEADKARLEKELGERGEPHGGLEVELRRVQAELDQADAKRAEAEAKLVDRDREIEELQDAVSKEQHHSEVAHAKPALPPRGGRAVDLEKAEAGKVALEKRLEDATRERDQVEEASAILRKELYGLRSKIEELEEREAGAGDLDAALEAAEAKVARLEATVAKEARMRKDLESRLEDMQNEPAGVEPDDEPEPADASEAEPPEGRVSAGGEPQEELQEAPLDDPGAEEAARGAAADLRGSLADPVEDEAPGETEQDDLKRIKGIGAVLEQKLQARGVRTLRQIADWSDADLEEISTALNLRNRAHRGDWRGQARDLCEGD